MKLNLPHLSLLLYVVFFISSINSWAQTTRYAGTYSELTTAISASSANDIINLTNDIVVSAQITLSTTLTINGNDFTISVPNPGLDDMGRFNGTTSAFRVFAITTSSTEITLNDLTIKGGYTSTGGAINTSSGTILRLNNCVVSNSRATSGGGGIYNNGVVYLNNSLIIRNAADYGGGFILNSSSRMYVENSTISENRSTSAGGGGGGAEVRSGAILYMNNSTLSNNQSTEIGGAINVATGTVYLTNCSVTGNVAYGPSIVTGGGIGNNSGNVYAINTLFAYNYHRDGGTSTNPTSYILDDVVAYSAQSNVRLYYCIHHASIPVGTQTLGNVTYSGLADGSDNTIFSGGVLSKLTDGTGTEIGTAEVFRPFLFNDGTGVAPTLQTGSFTLQPANRGTQTRFANNNNVNPVVAYEDLTGPTWVDLQGTSNSGQLVSTDQVGDSRSDPPAIGAIEGATDNLYMLKVNSATDGTVNGGTIYGDVYEDGTQVGLTAIPNSGYVFTSWDYVVGGTGTASTSNPYTVTVDKDITLVPVFSAAPGGTYSITYVGNDNTGGTAPATGTFTAATNIAGPGDLVRTGYTFTGWNTNANGSGTAYAENDAYSAGTNLILYAQWSPHATWDGSESSDWNTAANWVANAVPSSTDPVVIPSGCPNYPVFTGNQSVGEIVLDGDIDTGTDTLTIGSSTANPGTITYVSGHIIGSLKRWFAASTNSGAASGLFPLGDGTNDRFFTVEYTSAPSTGGTLKAHFRNEDGGSSGLPINGVASVDTCASFNVGRIYTSGFWRVEAADGLDGGSYDITMVGHNIDLAKICKITAIKRNSGADPWTQVGTHVATSGSLDSAIIKRTGASGWSDWGFGANSETFFPISLLYFTANPDQLARTVDIDWATEGEEAHSHFEVERSIDTHNWQAIAMVPGSGDTQEAKTYHYLDEKPLAINYYRLKSVDLDGTATYSSIQVAQFQEDLTRQVFKVYPNVSNGNFTIEGDEKGSYLLYNLSGQLVANGLVNGKAEIHGLAKGFYLLKIKGETKSEVHRVIVQ